MPVLVAVTLKMTSFLTPTKFFRKKIWNAAQGLMHMNQDRFPILNDYRELREFQDFSLGICIYFFTW